MTIVIPVWLLQECGWVDSNEASELQAENAKLKAERDAALRTAYELTPDCQSLEEAAAELVRITRKARTERDAKDEALRQAEAALSEALDYIRVCAQRRLAPKADKQGYREAEAALAAVREALK